MALADLDPRIVRQAAAVIRAKSRVAFSIESECFDRQIAAITAPGKRKAFICSRRAGKSRGFAPGLMKAVTTPPYTNVFFMAPTFKRAKRILWAHIKDINRRYALGGRPNETEAMLEFPALGPDVHLYTIGLKDRGEADKARGIPGKLWVLDETQDVREDVASYAIQDVIGPNLLDNAGSLWVGGTPGPVKAGYFYDITEGKKRYTWEHHHWTWRDNPMLPLRQSGITNDGIEEALLKEFGLTREDATWLREWCGQWTEDLNALVLQPAASCDWQSGPQKGWTYIVGFDIGINDADAIVVLGWQLHSRVVHLVYESAKPDQDVTDLAEALNEIYAKWKPIRMVGDLGSLGKKIGEEMLRRHQSSIEAADKQRKNEHIALLNAAIRRQEFLAPSDSIYTSDTKKLSWDLEARAKNELKVSKRFHSDVTDAVIYGFRHAQAYFEEPAPETQTFEQLEDKWLKAEEERAMTGDQDDGFNEFRELGYE